MRRRHLQFHTAADPLVEAAEPWLLYPLFAAGALTVLIGEAKYAGKSTLVLNLLAQMLRRDQFAARESVAAPVVYFTEQPPTSFRQTLYQSGVLALPEELKQQFFFIHRYEAAMFSWEATVKVLAEQCDQEAAKYLVIDTFSGCVGLKGEEENSAGGLIKENVEYLQDAAARQNLGVLVTHHMRKGLEPGTNLVNSSRGHSALCDTADVIAALRNPSNSVKHPKRTLEFAGRFADLPADPITLTLDAGSYQDLGSQRVLAAADTLCAVLPEQFDAESYNALADALDLERDLAWSALRYLERRGAVEVLHRGEYRRH